MKKPRGMVRNGVEIRWILTRDDYRVSGHLHDRLIDALIAEAEKLDFCVGGGSRVIDVDKVRPTVKRRKR